MKWTATQKSATAKAAAEQAKEGKKLEEKVQRDIRAAEQARADAIKNSEEASQ